MKMTTDGFLAECNNTNLLKEFRPITAKTLKQADFVKDSYDLHDLTLLRRRLFFIEPVVPTSLKPVFKDLIHHDALSRLANKKLLIAVRKELGMPHSNRGFELIRDPLPPKQQDRFAHHPAQLLGNDVSPEFTEWFYGHVDGQKFEDAHKRWQAAGAIVTDKLRKAVDHVMDKWELPNRYVPVIIELILLNRIVPAPSGASMTLRWLSTSDGLERIESPGFDIDTTMDERLALERKDVFGLFKNRASYLSGKARSTRRAGAQTDELIKQYNQLKGEGRKGSKSDKAIYEELSRRFKLKPRTIQKRITGK